MIYDVSGNSSPNEQFKDIRLSNATIGDDPDCAFKINGACITNLAEKAPAISKTDCESLKSDLGIQYCNVDTDYWAGAVKRCGGKDKVLTPAELDVLAAYVFQNDERAISLGLVKSGSQYTYVWGNSEYSGNNINYASMRRFLVIGYFGNKADDGNWGDRDRSQANYAVFCKK